MPVINRMAELQDDITAWRRDFHRNPELLYEVHETAASVAEKLKSFGCDEVVTAIGRTGVVAVIKGKNADSGPVIGLRADMDALPIEETSGKDWASQKKGIMHACGHDGHTAMLLGAARYLAETRNFSGKAVLIFQPAEEGGAGAKAMIDDGLMDRFGIQEVYGLHNMPGMAIGEFAIRKGAIMASADEFSITIKGRGGHAAQPHNTIDPIMIGSQFVNAVQSVVSRNSDPIESLVVSVTQFHAGTAHNVIPGEARLHGTVRALNGEVRDDAQRRIGEVVRAVAQAFGAEADYQYRRGYPVTVNHHDQTDKAIAIARQISGDGAVANDAQPVMGGEDFAFMLQARPGAFIFMGNGDSAGLHNPNYDFDDNGIPYGTSYWARLIETLMPAS